MLKMVRNVVLGAVAVMAASAPAQAVLLNASYTLQGGVLTMVFDGTVQGDGDTIVINSMFAPKFNGVTPAMVRSGVFSRFPMHLAALRLVIQLSFQPPYRLAA